MKNLLPNDSEATAVEDPQSLFLDRLYKIQVSHRLTAGVLRAGAETFLLPLDERLFELPAPSRTLADDSAPVPGTVGVAARREGDVIVVELWLPFREEPFARRYAPGEVCDLHRTTPGFVVWPDFESGGWRDYYYYQGGDTSELSLRPYLSPGLGWRSDERHTGDGTVAARWWHTSEPARALLATGPQGGKTVGLVLGPFGGASAEPVERWGVAIDLGAVHTRVFYSRPGGEIEPLTIQPRACLLLGEAPRSTFHEFFRLGGEPKAELPSQVLVPRGSREDGEPWLPSHGVAVTGHLGIDFPYDAARSSWTAQLKGEAARVYFSHLLVMIRAEAFDRGARVAEIRCGGEPAALSVTRYLAAKEDGGAEGVHLALDVGGGKSEIALWHDGRLELLQSVPCGGGALSAFLCQEAYWEPYCDLVGEMLPSWDAALGRVEPDLRLPHFHASLDVLRGEGLLGELRRRLAGHRSLRLFLGHASFLYGALLYYLGFLARARRGNRAPGTAGEKYLVHLCGKGSAFFEWIQNDDQIEILRRVFRAGLEGPDARRPVTAEVELRPVRRRKWEVGYGQLADGTAGLDGPRRVGPAPAAEHGYLDLGPFDELTAGSLRRLAEAGAPAVPTAFPELKRFLTAWVARDDVPLPAVLPASFRNALIEHLTGHRGEKAGPAAVSEPLFFHECRLFYEAATGFPRELWPGS